MNRYCSVCFYNAKRLVYLGVSEHHERTASWYGRIEWVIGVLKHHKDDSGSGQHVVS